MVWWDPVRPTVPPSEQGFITIETITTGFSRFIFVIPKIILLQLKHFQTNINENTKWRLFLFNRTFSLWNWRVSSAGPHYVPTLRQSNNSCLNLLHCLPPADPTTYLTLLLLQWEHLAHAPWIQAQRKLQSQPLNWCHCSVDTATGSLYKQRRTDKFLVVECFWRMSAKFPVLVWKWHQPHTVDISKYLLVAVVVVSVVAAQYNQGAHTHTVWKEDLRRGLHPNL